MFVIVTFSNLIVPSSGFTSSLASSDPSSLGTSATFFLTLLETSFQVFYFTVPLASSISTTPHLVYAMLSWIKGVEELMRCSGFDSK